MKLYSLVLLFLFVGCSQTKPSPNPPNLSWTSLDEPPLFPDCPKEDAQANWKCFMSLIQQKLEKDFTGISYSPSSKKDTLFVTLKVDTIGQLHVLGLAKENPFPMRDVLLSKIDSIFKEFPLLQPAFKTNLEVPVEVKWTLPLCLSN